MEQAMVEAKYKENVVHSEGQMPGKIYPCRFNDSLQSIRLHWHQELEITLICEGSIQYRIGNTEIIAQTGDILIISPGMLHSANKLPDINCNTESIVYDLQMFCSNTAEGAIIQVLLPIITQKRRFQLAIHPKQEGYSELLYAFQAVLQCYYEKSFYWGLLFKERLLHFVYLLLRYNYLVAPSQNETPLFQGRSEELIREILQYIINHPSESLSIETLAAISNYSPSHFMKVFKQSTGLTCSQFIRQHRLGLAADLLKETDHSITDISSQCGYDNLSYFISCFRKYYNCSPSQYRKNGTPRMEYPRDR